MKKIFPGKELILKRNRPDEWKFDNFTILYVVMEENGVWYLVTQTPYHKFPQYVDEDIISTFIITPEIQEFIDKVKAAYVPPPKKKCGDLTMVDLMELSWIAFKNGEMTGSEADVKEWAKERNIQLPS